MRKLKAKLYEENINHPEKVISIVEEYFEDLFKYLDNQSSILCEKHEGASDLVHYYMGKGMSLRDVADEAGILVNWNSKHNTNGKGNYGDFS